MLHALVICLLAVAMTGAQRPPTVQNARVETRQDSSIERAITQASAAAEPTWIGWRATMVPGERNLCSTWSNAESVSRGTMLEDGPRDVALPVFTPPSGALQIEAGTSLVVLLRIADGAVERARVVGDDCPIDAGGRTLVWLPAVSTSSSVAFLASLAAPPTLAAESDRRLGSTAVMALALHADASADAALDRILSTPVTDGQATLRDNAATWTGRARGQRGLEKLLALVKSERDEAFRRTLTSAIAETRQPGTLPALLALARSDANEQVRGEAIFGFARMAPPSELQQVRGLLAADSSKVVKQRAIRGLSRRPAGTSVPLLIELARVSTDSVVRTEAVRALTQSRDPAAVAYLTSVLTR